jgi:hypothetical protein
MAARKGCPIARRTMVSRILGYASSSFLNAENFAAGLEWYDNGRKLAAEMAEEFDVTPEIAAYVIAATSPRTIWSFNVKHARAILAYDDAPSGAMGTNDTRGRMVRDFGVSAIGNGPKVNAFARNLSGDDNAVTIDMWAVRAACGDIPDNILTRRGVYETIAEAYRIAARKFGITPAQMQAVIWVAIRGRAD